MAEVATGRGRAEVRDAFAMGGDHVDDGPGWGAAPARATWGWIQGRRGGDCGVVPLQGAAAGRLLLSLLRPDKKIDKPYSSVSHSCVN